MVAFLPLLLGGGAIAGGISYFFGDDVTEGVVEGAVETVTGQIPIIIENTVPALVEGVLSAFESVLTSFKGREVAFYQGVTVIILSYVTLRTIKQVTAIPKGAV